jgi:hypothetical protein
MEAAEIERLGAELPIPEVVLPALHVAGLTSSDIEQLARVLRTSSVTDMVAGG